MEPRREKGSRLRGEGTLALRTDGSLSVLVMASSPAPSFPGSVSREKAAVRASMVPRELEYRRSGWLEPSAPVRSERPDRGPIEALGHGTTRATAGRRGIGRDLHTTSLP